jgi:hypothetical protein
MNLVSDLKDIAMRKFALFLPLLLLSACVEPEQYAHMKAVGGDRQAGVMQMSVTYNPSVEKLNWQASQFEANRHCRAWGFINALPFEDTRNQCQAYNAMGSCTNAIATRTYQCSVR